MKEYLTEQRKSLLTLFKENSDRRMTIDEIRGLLPQQTQISRSAVYRNVDKMVQDGLLRKSVVDDGRKTCYQYIDCGSCCERVHLRCEKCGRVFHMDDRGDEERLKEILGKSGFRLDEEHATLPGTCKNCL